MSLLFSKRDGSPFPEPIIPPFPLAYGGTSADNAMRLDAVWACVRLLSDTVAMLPLQALDIRSDTEVPLPSKRWPSLLVEPAPGLTMSDWLRQMMISLLLRGNAYAEWTGDVRQGGQLIPLAPDRVRLTVENGQKVYRVNGIVKPNIFHMTGYVMPGDISGMSPIGYHATMIQTQMDIDAFARGYFQDAPHPAAVLTTDKPINQTQAKEIKDRVMSSVPSREPLVLGLGLNMTTLSVSPEESQFLATQQYGVSRIARIFGVPPEMIGGGAQGSSITYANVTQRALDFLTYSVQHWLMRFEQSISNVLPNRQHTRFDTDELIRLAPTDAATVDRWRVGQGIKTINEARAQLGYAPVSWGDEPYLPGMSPAAAGQAVAAEAAGTNEEI